MAYDFDTFHPRQNTGSLKWDKYTGRDIIPLWVADMDFKTSPEITHELQRRLNHGIFGYTIPYTGVVEAVQGYLKRSYDWEVKEEWLCWTPGLVPALNVMCRAVGKPGDAFMTATPVYPPFLSAPGNQDRELLAIPLKHDGNWQLDFEAMEAAVTPRTRLLILCHPHNPVGHVYTRKELLKVAEFAGKHDLVVCSDEIHCDLILDEKLKHIPFATLSAEVAARTVTMMAPSKTYNLPGLGCSFVIIPDARLRSQFKKAAQGLLTEINSFGYAGCMAAYNHGEPWRQELLTYLRGNRELVYEFIKKRMPQLKLHPMEATYLAWIDCRSLGLDDPAALFEKHGAGLSDGRYFGEAGKGWVRLNFGCPRSLLQEGLERMERALGGKKKSAAAQE